MSDRAPIHHPPDELLLEYASGATHEAVSLFVATHCALCPQCRSRVEDLEQVGGALLQQADSVEPSPGTLDALLARLDDTDADADAEPPAAATPTEHLVFPEPLRSYLPDPDPGKLPWDSLLPGYKQITLPLMIGDVPVRLARMSPRFVIPSHTHGGTELSMVLTGGYKDDGKQYLRGDVSVRDEQHTHSVHVDDDDHCIAMTVSSSWVKPRDLKFWLATWFHSF